MHGHFLYAKQSDDANFGTLSKQKLLSKPENWSVISRLNINSALKVKSLCIDVADE